MPLYDVTYTKDGVYLNPADMEGSDYVYALKRDLNPKTFERITKTIDEGLEALASAGVNKLVWTKTGALLGYSSMQPKKHVDHVWENVIKVMGDGKACLKSAGSLVRWRISLREETWLLYRQETDSIDPDTGRIIYVSEYWIKEDFVPKKKPKKR